MEKKYATGELRTSHEQKLKSQQLERNEHDLSHNKVVTKINKITSLNALTQSKIIDEEKSVLDVKYKNTFDDTELQIIKDKIIDIVLTF